MVMAKVPLTIGYLRSGLLELESRLVRALRVCYALSFNV